MDYYLKSAPNRIYQYPTEFNYVLNCSALKIMNSNILNEKFYSNKYSYYRTRRKTKKDGRTQVDINF